MSKTTKIIAALGVVAGLGVAALPAFTYAAETVSGNVDLYVEVNPAIAMTIVGNNDDNTLYGTTGDNATVGVKAPTGASTIDGLDVSTFDVTTGAKASSSYVAMLPNAVANAKSTVSVYTNAAAGYNLAVKAATNANLALADNSDTIAAVAGIPAITTNPGWAFKVAGADGKTNVGTINSSTEEGAAFNYADDTQMTTTDQTIVTASAKTSDGDSFDVTYDIATKADQSTGVYHTELVYTATTR